MTDLERLTAGGMELPAGQQLEDALAVLNAYPPAEDFAAEVTIASMLTHINELRDGALLEAYALLLAEHEARVRAESTHDTDSCIYFKKRAEQAEADATKWKLLADERWEQCKHESAMRDRAEAEVQQRDSALYNLARKLTEAEADLRTTQGVLEASMKRTVRVAAEVERVSWERGCAIGWLQSLGETEVEETLHDRWTKRDPS